MRSSPPSNGGTKRWNQSTRCWEREDVVFDPVHYLPLVEQKIDALDQAAPLQGWDLPEEFATLRRLMGKHPSSPAALARVSYVKSPIMMRLVQSGMLGVAGVSFSGVIYAPISQPGFPRLC